MNIFYLDKSPSKSAEYMNNSHVVKMIVESAQILSTAHIILDGENKELYKATHKNHPSSKWVRESSEHYMWLYNHFVSLLDEYTLRYEKIHKTSRLKELLSRPPKNITNKGFIEPPQAMPDDVKDSDTITAYRNYYIKHKSHIAKWKVRNKPEWYNG